MDKLAVFPPLFVKAQLSLVPKGERSFYFQSLSHLSEGLAVCRPFSKGFGGVEDKNHNLEAHAGHQLRCSYVVMFFSFASVYGRLLPATSAKTSL